MSMAPLETENSFSSTNLGLARERESVWLSLTIILAAIIGIIALYSYAT